MQFVNLTPHAITLRLSSGEDSVIQPSEQVARVSEIPGNGTFVPGIPVQVFSPPKRGEVTGLENVYSDVPLWRWRRVRDGKIFSQTDHNELSVGGTRHYFFVADDGESFTTENYSDPNVGTVFLFLADRGDRFEEFLETVFIVSMQVREAVAAECSRQDVFSPGTGPSDGAIREPEKLPDGSPNPRKGQIIAVTRLIRSV